MKTLKSKGRIILKKKEAQMFFKNMKRPNMYRTPKYL